VFFWLYYLQEIARKASFLFSILEKSNHFDRFVSPIAMDQQLSKSKNHYYSETYKKV